MGSIFFEITIIICVAALLSVLFRILRQPLILAYILTGIIVGPLGIISQTHKEVLHSMGELGITLLLFMLGLELRLSDLRSIGKAAIVTGIFQLCATVLLGYFISLFLGFSTTTSWYIGLALSFSSTIVVVKLLSDKRDVKGLYGKITIGILLVQDFFAVVALILLSGFKAQGELGISHLYPFVLVMLQAVFLFSLVFVMSRKLIPILVHLVARSSETLFLFSLAWVFGVAAFVTTIGFSIEIGGLVAGLALANSLENFQIVARIRALRDFFITIFFVFLGTEIVFGNIAQVLFPALLFSLVVLLAKPLFVMASMGMMGYRKRTSFLSAVSLSQISEFSLIVLFLGNRLGHVSENVIGMVTLAGALSFVISSYAMQNSNALFKFLLPYLGIFEKETTRQEHIGEVKEFKNHIVLVGANRIGGSILDMFKEGSNELIVIDFDPEVVQDLRSKGVQSLFGDISDLDIQEKAQLENAKLVISTVADVEDNLRLMRSINRVKSKAKVVVVAHDTDEAKELYRAGVDYVFLPHLLSGKHIARLLRENDFERFDHLRQQDMKHF